MFLTLVAVFSFSPGHTLSRLSTADCTWLYSRAVSSLAELGARCDLALPPRHREEAQPDRAAGVLARVRHCLCLLSPLPPHCLSLTLHCHPPFLDLPLPSTAFPWPSTASHCLSLDLPLPSSLPSGATAPASPSSRSATTARARSRATSSTRRPSCRPCGTLSSRCSQRPCRCWPGCSRTSRRKG